MPSINNLLTRPRHRRARRRGSLYIAVLGVTTIVGMMSLAAMHVVRLNLKASTGRNDRYEAAVLAMSAVENALIVLDNDSSWRTNLQSGLEYPATPVTMGNGSFTWKVVDDDDGNLADDASDSVLLQGLGRVGNVTHVEEVRLQPTDVGLTCLEASLHSHGRVDLGSLVTITTNQTVSSNDRIKANAFSASIDGNAEAGGNIIGTVTGTTDAHRSPPRQMPGSDVFDYYINMGTHIELPPGSGYLRLGEVLLSPQSNPFGSWNLEGIYVIDCRGGEIRVEDLRVVGTLVLLNLHPNSRIAKEVHFEPAVPNYPSLMVEGSIQLRNDATNPLDEDTEDVNFNPPGTPYQGIEDEDESDVYPNLIKGLVYVSGELNLVADWDPSTIDGVVVCGSIAANSALNLTYRSTFLDYPPPGFAAGSKLEIAPGSWKRVPSP